ncbi:MAG: hypothetical protein HY961_14735 [Ignavibacteriae bacterium]|nr:hypothetical protein [Ignavibacteriota bacterium]
MNRLLIMLLAAVLLCSVEMVAQQKGKRHPATEPGQTCVECHEALTPEVVTGYEKSLHGVNTVPCIVCHGATDATFVAKPRKDRCLGCHESMMISVAKAFPKKNKECVECHVMHELSPHKKFGGTQQ